MPDRTCDPPGGATDPDLFGAVFATSPRPLLLIAADAPRYTMVAVNEAHARAFWTTREALEGRGVFEVFPHHPEPAVARFMRAIRHSFDRVLATGEPDQMPPARLATRGRGGDVLERYWTATNTPILGPGGVTHIVSATLDVTGEVHERRSEEARRLLMREVDHRARNALTMVQSLVRLSTADSLEEFRAVLDGRIESLARAQTSLAARKWEGAFLEDIVRGALAIAAPERLTVAGPRVVLPPNDVQALSMIIHELATNAIKYGSLARAAGALAVTWTRGEDRTVELVWTERGVAPIAAPQAEGFGSRLIARLVGQLRGAIVRDWPPSGLVARLSFPVASAPETAKAER